MSLVLGRALSASQPVIVLVMIVLSNSVVLGLVHDFTNKEQITCDTYILFNRVITTTIAVEIVRVGDNYNIGWFAILRTNT